MREFLVCMVALNFVASISVTIRVCTMPWATHRERVHKAAVICCIANTLIWIAGAIMVHGFGLE